MGRRAREGFKRLALAIAVVLLVQWLASDDAVDRFLRSVGGPWILLLYLAGILWVWAGFEDRWVPRRREEQLRTRRLLLRRAKASDIKPLHAMLSDPEVTRYWHTATHQSLAQTKEWVETILVPEDPEMLDDFIIERRGTVIGMLCSMRIPLVSFVLAREHWGRGYAREALRANVDYMIDRGFPYLCAATAERNAAARALLSRGGFCEVGRSDDLWQVHDRPVSAVHYRINRKGSGLTMSDPFHRREAVEAAEAASPTARPARTA
jgi:RimJ/RimL family protein N-acetyltransferase